MAKSELQALVERMLANAADDRIDDVAFRRQATRLAARIERTLTQAASRYAFIAVPNGTGGMASVSMPRAIYEELATAVGGNDRLNALARKVACGYRPAAGMSRSAYVRKRLQHLAARSAASDR